MSTKKEKPTQKSGTVGRRVPKNNQSNVINIDSFYENYVSGRPSGSAGSARPPTATAKSAAPSGKRRSPPISKNAKRKNSVSSKTPKKSSGVREPATSQHKKSKTQKEVLRQKRQEQISQTHRRRRKKKKRNFTLYYIILAVFLVIAGVTLSMTMFFNIETIQVSGSHLYTLADVTEFLDAKPGDNLLRINTKKLSETVLDELKKADMVKVKRIFPTTLLVEIEDGKPKTQLLMDEKYYYLSQRGRILDIKGKSATNVPIIIGPKPQKATIGSYIKMVIENEERDWMNILQTEMKNNGINDISVMDISDTINVKLYYQNRIEIKIGSFSELDTKLAMVKKAFESGDIGIEESGSIDITSPDMLVFDSDAEWNFPGMTTEGWKWTDPSSASETETEDSTVSSAESKAETVSEISGDSSVKSTE